MTINSFLCKYFDDDDKMYVTVGDVIIKVLFMCAIIFFGSMILFVVGGVTVVIINSLSPEISPIIHECATSACENEKVIASVLIGLGFDTIIVISIYMLFLISQIKVAKCERR